MSQSRGNVTVVVCEYEGWENRQIVVIDYHIDEKEAKRLAKDLVGQGWATNHNLPFEIGQLIADAYTYDVRHTSVHTPLHTSK